ncbi:MAG: type I secretion system permease/ATPase [Sulfurospirillaceae bacterium]|nr:type I secretion system permease/ATPase [Sulfurospirillaceae bacterium]
MVKEKHEKFDSLLATLSMFTKLYHKPYSAESLIYGLPMEDYADNGLFSIDSSKSLMTRAALRAGLKSTLIKKKLEDISPLFLPMILLLHNKEACILEEFSPERKQAKIIFPYDESYEWIDIEKLNEEYLGYGFLLKRVYQYNEFDHKRVNLNTDHWFWSTIKFSAKIYKDVIIASILINMFVLATPLFTRNVYNRVIPNQAVETLWYFAGGVIVIYILDIILKYTRIYFLEMAAKKSDVIMSSIIFEKVLDMKMSVLPKSIGSFASNLKDFDSIRSFLTSATLTAFIDIPFAILFLVVIWYLGGSIVWVPITTILLILLYAILIRRPLYNRIKLTHQAAAQKNGVLIEALQNIDAIKTLGASSKIQWNWEESCAEIANKSLSSRLLSSSIPVVTSFLIQFNTIFVVVVGVYLIKDNLMTMGDLIAIVILVSRTIAPMGQSASLIANFEDVRSVYDIMDEIVNQPIERPKAKEFVKIEDIKGKIEFKNVSFSYGEEEKIALDDVSLTINPGEKVGLIGRIGSGKSTLIKLIINLYEPTSGSVLIDDIDIKQIDPADLRSNISYVDQNVKFFRGTLKENIKFGLPYVNDEEMIKAAKIAGVHEFCLKHPKGYDMNIGEQGLGLSGGQKQSVAIARALLKHTPIVIMDEPTISMDQQSENHIINEFKKNLKNKTIIFSTQKLSLLDAVDRIIVIHEGKILLDGPKAVVLSKLRGDQNAKQ